MATWNTIYTGIFDAFDAPGQYSIEIAKKDYVGDAFELTLSGIPVTQEWQEEGPKVPIKGCNLTVRMISKRLNGIEYSFSLADFYSEEDDTFLVYLYDNTNGVKLFKGFIVQDDCKEIQVDYAHEIVISATDNLGLLKERRLDEAALITGTLNSIEAAVIFQAPHTIYISYSPGNPLPFGIGTQITIFDIPYTISNIGNEDVLFGWPVTVVQDVIDAPLTITFVEWYVPSTINGYLPLKEFFRISLKSLGLGLGARVYSQLFPIGGSTGRWLEDTYVLAESFLENDQWLSCYEILERILNRFRASLFQCNGFWTIVRWGELWRYTTIDGATIPGYVYNVNWDFLTNTDSIQNFHFGDGTDCQTGVLRSINRPFNFVQDTFNYVNPESLLCNYNLQKLGELYSVFEDTVNLRTVYRYYAECWTSSHIFIFPPNPNIFIAVEIDNNLASEQFGVEVNRYMVISGPNGASLSVGAESAPIQINKGDVVEFSFSWRSDQSYALYTTVQWRIFLQNGGVIYGLDNDTVFGDTDTNTNGRWDNYTSSFLTYIFDGNSNATEWQNVTITAAPAPIDGLIYINLPQFPRFAPDYTTEIQNMQLNIKFNADSSLNTIGHQHTDTQTPQKVIKNNEKVKIFLDDSPRASISGTLFLEYEVNGLRTRSGKWNYTGALLQYSLGKLVTIEQLFQRWYPKDIYNGTTTYIKNNDGWIMNPMSVFYDGQAPALKRYVTGSLSVDYKNSACDFTIYELDNSDRTMAEFNLNNLYEFNYLYQNT
jgi:hypothetical protein